MAGIESRRWSFRKRIGRLRLGGRITRHRYPDPDVSDRWVIQPEIVYDRKRG